MYIERYLENSILKIHETFKVLYLGGPRQVGKTTMLLKLAKSFKFNYVTLDDLALRQLAKNDPGLFLQQFRPPLFIDEAQYAPELFPYIKIQVDKEKKNGLYWLTGSQHFSILKNVQESLAGRVGIVSLLGLSTGEIRGLSQGKKAFLPGLKKEHAKRLDINFIFKRILRGSFPALWQKKAPELEIFYNSYLQTYIDRDLREFFGMTKISEFHKFLQLCAARTGQILNYSELARDAGISVHAAREWINILESTMQIYLLKPYFSNFSKRIIKSPKLYFLDTGLAAYLTKWKTVETLISGLMAGPFFETYVLSELVKDYIFRGEEPPFYYLRDKQGHEVDLIIEQNQKLYPVEIKLAAKITPDDWKNISYFSKRLKNVKTAGVICFSPHNLFINRNVALISPEQIV